MAIRKVDYLYRSITPLNTIAPIVSGIGTVGETLTATKGAWLNAFLVVGQWYSNGTPLSGENNLTYTVTAATNGSLLYYKETTHPSTATVSSNVIGSWTPAEIATAAWFDASDTGTITESGGSVSQWDDKSGNDKHATQGTGAKQPTVGLNTINGLSSISFNGASNALTTVLTQLSTASIYIVANAQSKGTNQDSNLLGAATSYNSGGAFVSTQEYGSGNASEVVFYTSSLPVQQKYFNGNQLPFTETFDPAIHYHEVTNATTESLPYTLGNRNATNSSSGFKGDVGEVLIFNSVHDSATRQRVEGYLAWKWGLQGLLPANHPYKNGAPTV